MWIEGPGTGSPTGDGISGSFDPCGISYFVDHSPDRVVVVVFGTESIFGIGHVDVSAVSALVAVFAGFGKTTFVHEFPATGRGLTMFEGLDFQIQ